MKVIASESEFSSMSTYLIAERIEVHRTDAQRSISYERIQVAHTSWIGPDGNDSRTGRPAIALGPIGSTGEVAS